MKTCAIIYNPQSGHKNVVNLLPKIENMLNEYGYSVKIFGTEYSGHATEIVKNLDYVDLVISMGGDGTFNEAITGNYYRKDRLVCAHIPVGTTNDIGIMMGYGKNMINNLKLTLDGVIKNVDICLINDRPFIYVATIGKFAEIPYETPRKLKKQWGYLAYISEGIKSFFNKTKLHDVTYEIDGIEYRGLFSFIIISSANRIAGINNFYKDVKLDDNKFEVLLCNFAKKKDIIRSLYFLTLYDVEKVPGIHFYKTDKIKMKFAELPKKAWCIDGEMLEKNVKNYEITIDRNMKMMLPKKNIDKLFVKEQMKKIVIFLIKKYQTIPGKFHHYCKYQPSCSNYAIGVLNEFGFMKGMYLSIVRIIKCNPFSKGGFDPIPLREDKNEKKQKI